MYDDCSTKTEQKSRVGFHHERKIITRERLKLLKSSKPAPLIKPHLVMVEKQLCDSHLDEKRFEENAAVTTSNTSSDMPRSLVFVKLTLVLV